MHKCKGTERKGTRTVDRATIRIPQIMRHNSCVQTWHVPRRVGPLFSQFKDDRNHELVFPSPHYCFSRIYKHAAKSLIPMLQGVLTMEFVDDDKISPVFFSVPESSVVVQALRRFSPGSAGSLQPAEPTGSQDPGQDGLVHLYRQVMLSYLIAAVL